MNKYDLYALTTSISSELENVMKNKVAPEIKAIYNNTVVPIILIILAITFVVRLIFVWIHAQRPEGEFKWISLAVIFACFVFAGTTPLWIWNIIGI